VARSYPHQMTTTVGRHFKKFAAPDFQFGASANPSLPYRTRPRLWYCACQGEQFCTDCRWSMGAFCVNMVTILRSLDPETPGAGEYHVVRFQLPGGLMKKMCECAAIALALVTMALPADAKGCIKGALVGGAAGHFAGHHGVLGAAAGCVIGRHEANKAASRDRGVQQPSTAGPH
jgi:hypothetical protein